jgi:hypothetical protein
MKEEMQHDLEAQIVKTKGQLATDEGKYHQKLEEIHHWFGCFFRKRKTSPGLNRASVQ